MNNIKDSFGKVKEDMEKMNSKMNFLEIQLKETNEKLIEICEILIGMKEKRGIKEDISQKYIQKRDISLKKPMESQFYIQNKTYGEEFKTTSTDTSTPRQDINLRNDKILGISKGNQGVQTDRQTDRQTDTNEQNSFITAKNLLNSLDNLKKEIRSKFKKLTDQEILVFSTIYQLEEEIGYSDYKTLSKRLNLTESSIRDYVSRLINKSIPLEKRKINNKEIKINISPDLKKIATLNAILRLREI